MSDLSSLDDTSSGSEDDYNEAEQVSDEGAESENLTEIETIDSEPAIHSDVEIEEDEEVNNNPRVKDSRPPPPSWEGKRLSLLEERIMNQVKFGVLGDSLKTTRAS